MSPTLASVEIRTRFIKSLAFLAFFAPIACASTPVGQPAPAVATVSSATSEPTPVVAEPPLDPGEIRCGIDDGPVPIGALLQGGGARGVLPTTRLFKRADLRDMAPPTNDVRAAGPTADTTWSLEAQVKAPPRFQEKVAACSADVALVDGGDHRMRVRFARTGAATSVLARKASGFDRCLAQAACLLEGGPSTGSLTRETIFHANVTPPRSDLDVVVGSERVLPPIHRRPGAPPLRKTILEQRLRAAVHEVAAACVEAHPPTKSFEWPLTVRFETGSPSAARVYFAGEVTPYTTTLMECLSPLLTPQLASPPLATKLAQSYRLSVTVTLREDVLAQP